MDGKTMLPEFDHEAGLTVGDEHHGWAEHLVVVRSHRVAVGAGHRRGDEVPHGEVLGEPPLAHEEVTGLTVLADEADPTARGRNVS